MGRRILIVDVLLLCLMSICASSSFGVFDYTISDVYYNDTLTLNDQSVQVLDEGIDKIVAYGASYVNIVNTTPYIYNANSGIGRIELYDTSIGDISGGEIDTVGTYGDTILNISGGKAGVDALASGNSVVNISGGEVGSYFVNTNASINQSGGEINGLWFSDDATSVLKGGLINKIVSRQFVDEGKHIDLYCQTGWSWLYDSPGVIGGITGNWWDGTAFSIDFTNITNYDPVWTNINVIVPEPATLVLLSIGAVMLRRRK